MAVTIKITVSDEYNAQIELMCKLNSTDKSKWISGLMRDDMAVFFKNQKEKENQGGFYGDSRDSERYKAIQKRDREKRLAKQGTRSVNDYATDNYNVTDDMIANFRKAMGGGKDKKDEQDKTYRDAYRRQCRTIIARCKKQRKDKRRRDIANVSKVTTEMRYKDDDAFEELIETMDNLYGHSLYTPEELERLMQTAEDKYHRDR